MPPAAFQPSPDLHPESARLLGVDCWTRDPAVAALIEAARALIPIAERLRDLCATRPSIDRLIADESARFFGKQSKRGGSMSGSENRELAESSARSGPSWKACAHAGSPRACGRKGSRLRLRTSDRGTIDCKRSKRKRRRWQCCGAMVRLPNRGKVYISRLQVWRGRLVELRGIEPLTSAVRLQRSPI